MTVKKSRDELLEALRRQASNMRRSAKSFDEGALEEAERLAASIYILCHDGQSQKSLLKSLGLRSKITFPDTGTNRNNPPGVITFGPPLVTLCKKEGSLEFRAPLDDAKIAAELPFHKWWDQSVYTNLQRRSLSRKNLVHSLRSQDGGAHVDKSLRFQEYRQFSRNGDHVSWDESGDYAGRILLPAENQHWLTMRQMTWEVDQVLQRLGF